MIDFPLKMIFLIIFPFIVLIVPFYMNKFGKAHWVMRKYMHTVGIGTMAIYGAVLSSIGELFILVITDLIIAGFLSLHPKIRFIQKLVEFGTRTGESKSEALLNTFFTIGTALYLMIVFVDQRYIFSAAVLTVSLGDGLGEFIGRPFGKIKFRIFSEKSIEGSIGVLIGSFLGIILSYIIFDVFDTTQLIYIGTVALLVTFIEAFSFAYLDNIIMQLVSAFFLFKYVS